MEPDRKARSASPPAGPTTARFAQVAFKPDWTRHKNAAPFKRNDAMLEALPIGVIVFPGSGIVENLADKARKMGIPVWRVWEGWRVSAGAGF